MTTKQRKVVAHVRWMIARDVPKCATIDSLAAAGEPWVAEDFLRCLRQRNCVGMVVEEHHTCNVVGFMVYELHADRLDLTRLAVKPNCRDEGFGSALLAKLLYKVTSHRRDHMTLPVDGARWPVRAGRGWASADVRGLCGGDEVPPLYALADALEEAGCDDANLLATFRRGGRLAEVIYQAVRATLAG